MSQDPSRWLRGHMRDHIDRAAALGTPRNVVNLDRAPPGAPKSRGAAAIELVHQAAEAIGDIEDRANETEARAKSLVRDAIDKLHAAEARIEAAESARRDAINDTAARIAEAVEALRRAEARIAVAESEAAAAAARAQAAEARALEAEAALRNIEHAIRTKLLREAGVSYQESGVRSQDAA
jgi:chromosome segregation ATPase